MHFYPLDSHLTKLFEGKRKKKVHSPLLNQDITTTKCSKLNTSKKLFDSCFTFNSISLKKFTKVKLAWTKQLNCMRHVALAQASLASFLNEVFGKKRNTQIWEWNG